MRLFVAVDLDNTAQQAVAAEQRRLVRAFGEAAGSLRMVKADQIHLTLVFIGNRDVAQSAPIVSALQQRVSMAPFRLSFGGIGVFPGPRRPRVLFLGILDGAAMLVRLQENIAQRLEQVGVPRESRPFHPHLTLARFRDGARSVGRHIISGDRREVAAVDVASAVLYESRLSSSAPTYIQLASAALAL